MMTAQHRGSARPHAGPGARYGRAGGFPGQASTAIGWLAFTAWLGVLHAGPVLVPNGSFESPVSAYVDTRIDAWQKTPKPFWFDEGVNGPWDQLVGLFLNTPPGDARHIDNCDGNQAIWLFALPQAGLFQDYDSTDWASTVPTHAFNVKYEVGKSYSLSVGALGGGGGMSNGVTMEISLYYRDGSGNAVTVAATSITNTPDLFTNATRLVDFQAHLPAVKANDPWAGKNIGLQLLSTVNPASAGGYWDLDNVRLTAVVAPALTGLTRSNGQSLLQMRSEPERRFEVLASTNVALAASNWTSLGTLTNLGGNSVFLDVETHLNRRFYRLRQLP